MAETNTSIKYTSFQVAQCERAIGWWITERYRCMHGYKQEQSALGVSRLIAYAVNHLARGLRLADLMA